MKIILKIILDNLQDFTMETIFLLFNFLNLLLNFMLIQIFPKNSIINEHVQFVLYEMIF